MDKIPLAPQSNLQLYSGLRSKLLKIAVDYICLYPTHCMFYFKVSNDFVSKNMFLICSILCE